MSYLGCHQEGALGKQSPDRLYERAHRVATLRRRIGELWFVRLGWLSPALPGSGGERTFRLDLGCSRIKRSGLQLACWVLIRGMLLCSHNLHIAALSIAALALP